MKEYIWGMSSVLLATVAQLLLKAGMILLPFFTFGSHWWSLDWLQENRIALVIVLCGLVGYALSMFSWLLVLRTIPLNKAYSLISLSYVFVYLLAIALPYFQEELTVLKSLGVMCILLGVWLINHPRKIR